MTQQWTDRAVSAEDAVSHVLSGMNLFIHGAAATPTPLVVALASHDVENVTTFHLHLEGRCRSPIRATSTASADRALHRQKHARAGE